MVIAKSCKSSISRYWVDNVQESRSIPNIIFQIYVEPRIQEDQKTLEEQGYIFFTEVRLVKPSNI